MFACTGILFNHELPLRPERFVTKKIIKSAVQIATGNLDELHLGNISISRDWGSAEEYVEAMWLMMQQDKAEDFVIATGETNTLEHFIRTTFDILSLDWREYVNFDQSLNRPSEIMVSRGNPSKAQNLLGWQAKCKMRDVIKEMIEFEYAKIRLE